MRINIIGGKKIMTLKEEQKAFDEVKWADSVRLGTDQCGTYGFCSVCKKSLTYPCARAKRKAEKGSICVATVRSKK